MDLDSFYTSPEWVTLRDLIVARDRFRCTVGRLLGGACSNTLHVHHLIGIDDDFGLALDPENLATVCAHHHPKWEAVRRAVLRSRGTNEVGECNHYHPYPAGREACRRRRARERGLIAA